MVVIVAALLIFLCSTAFGMASMVSQQITNSNILAMEELALHDSRSIKNSLDIRWKEMETVAKRLETEKFSNAAEVAEDLRKEVENITSADFLMLVTDSGTEYRSTGLINPGSEISDIVGNNTGRLVSRYNEKRGLTKENRKEMLVMGVPIKLTSNVGEGGAPVHFAWLFARMGISTLEQELKIDSYQGEGFSSVIDYDGNYIINISRSHNIGTFDNFFTELERAEFDGYATVQEVRAVLEEEANTAVGAESIIYTTDKGEKFIMVITPIDFADWFFITTVPTSVFNTQTDRIMSSFVFLLVLVVSVFFGIFLLTVKQRNQVQRLKVAEAESTAKTAFLFNMSHDIRTPMNAILGFTDIALNHIGEPDRVRDCLGKIRNSGALLLSLINDILEMSRIESGKLEIKTAPANLQKLGDHVNPMVESLAMAKSVTYSYDDTALENPYVKLDVEHINRALVNLLTNAVKYTNEGGSVDFKLEQLGPVENGQATYRFTIADTGIGMSEAFLKNNLYQQFARETTTTLSKQEGTGLGLAIVKRIVDAMDGEIGVESEVGKGTTFTVTLTLEIIQPQDIEDQRFDVPNHAVGEAVPQLAGKRALLVEDNALNREIGMEVLTDVGLLVDSAADGSLAVSAIQEKGVDYYDFVLMDIQMPVMNGYEATQAIRELPGGESVIIVAVSANAFAEDVQKSKDAGMNAHIPKPVNVDELLAVLLNA